jgi:hypothetical protein
VGSILIIWAPQEQKAAWWIIILFSLFCYFGSIDYFSSLMDFSIRLRRAWFMLPLK